MLAGTVLARTDSSTIVPSAFGRSAFPPFPVEVVLPPPPPPQPASKTAKRRMGAMRKNLVGIGQFEFMILPIWEEAVSSKRASLTCFQNGTIVGSFCERAFYTKNLHEGMTRWLVFWPSRQHLSQGGNPLLQRRVSMPSPVGSFSKCLRILFSQLFQNTHQPIS